MSAHTARFVDSESAPCHCWLCHTSLRRHSDNADILPLPLPSLVPPSDTTIAVFSALNKWETRPISNSAVFLVLLRMPEGQPRNRERGSVSPILTELHRPLLPSAPHV